MVFFAMTPPHPNLLRLRRPRRGLPRFISYSVTRAPPILEGKGGILLSCGGGGGGVIVWILVVRIRRALMLLTGATQKAQAECRSPSPHRRPSSQLCFALGFRMG